MGEERSIRRLVARYGDATGCAQNVARQAAQARQCYRGPALQNTLVIGSSAGYGLASLIALAFGARSNCLGVALEREPILGRRGSAGWYNALAVEHLAAGEGLHVRTLMGDAFASDIKDATIALLRSQFAPLDLVVYSIAAPKRVSLGGSVWNSAMKPIGQPYVGMTVDLALDRIRPVSVDAATEAEIEGTIKVMGGEDIVDWVNLLMKAGLLNEGCRVVAYSYVGGSTMNTNYRDWTIGRAKTHLEMTMRTLSPILQSACRGDAYAVVTVPAVTQASVAIPAAALYQSILGEILEERGLAEAPIDQILRLCNEHFRTVGSAVTDDEHRIRLDASELRPDIQDEVQRRWEALRVSPALGSRHARWVRAQFEEYLGFGDSPLAIDDFVLRRATSDQASMRRRIDASYEELGRQEKKLGDIDAFLEVFANYAAMVRSSSWDNRSRRLERRPPPEGTNSNLVS